MEGKGMDGNDMNFDFEKLRKKLVIREFASGLIYRSPPENCANAVEANPEQLIKIARRYNVNIEKYRIKE